MLKRFRLFEFVYTCISICVCVFVLFIIIVRVFVYTIRECTRRTPDGGGRVYTTTAQLPPRSLVGQSTGQAFSDATALRRWRGGGCRRRWPAARTRYRERTAGRRPVIGGVRPGPRGQPADTMPGKSRERKGFVYDNNDCRRSWNYNISTPGVYLLVQRSRYDTGSQHDSRRRRRRRQSGAKELFIRERRRRRRHPAFPVLEGRLHTHNLLVRTSTLHYIFLYKRNNNDFQTETTSWTAAAAAAAAGDRYGRVVIIFCAHGQLARPGGPPLLHSLFASSVRVENVNK